MSMLNSYVALLERAGLAKCVLLATVSSAAWYILFRVADPFGFDLWPDSLGALPAWLLVWSTGSIYSVLVLFRYIGIDARAPAWAFAFAGMFTYWMGAGLVLWLDPVGDARMDLPISGAIAAGVLGLVVMRFGTLRFSPLWLVALCAAGGLGGAFMVAFGYLFFAGGMARFDGHAPDWYEPTIWLFFGHAAWQTLTCIALYFTPTSDTAARAGTS